MQFHIQRYRQCLQRVQLTAHLLVQINMNYRPPLYELLLQSVILHRGEDDLSGSPGSQFEVVQGERLTDRLLFVSGDDLVQPLRLRVDVSNFGPPLVEYGPIEKRHRDPIRFGGNRFRMSRYRYDMRASELWGIFCRSVTGKRRNAGGCVGYVCAASICVEYIWVGETRRSEQKMSGGCNVWDQNGMC
jgi:hypothetical protein